MNAPAVSCATRVQTAAFTLLINVVVCGSAIAAGINLSWDDCGTYGVENKSFACNTNTGSPAVMIGSFVAPPGINEFLGVSTRLTISTVGPLPDWWKHGTGILPRHEFDPDQFRLHGGSVQLF